MCYAFEKKIYSDILPRLPHTLISTCNKFQHAGNVNTYPFYYENNSALDTVMINRCLICFVAEESGRLSEINKRSNYRINHSETNHAERRPC